MFYWWFFIQAYFPKCLKKKKRKEKKKSANKKHTIFILLLIWLQQNFSKTYVQAALTYAHILTNTFLTCKILRISYKDHVTNEEVRAKIQQAIGPHEDLVTIAKRRKLQWCGHVSRSSGLARTILQHQGRDRPGVRQVPEGSWEQRKMEETGCEVISGATTTPEVKGYLKWRRRWCSLLVRGQLGFYTGFSPAAK